MLQLLYVRYEYISFFLEQSSDFGTTPFSLSFCAEEPLASYCSRANSFVSMIPTSHHFLGRRRDFYESSVSSMKREAGVQSLRDNRVSPFVTMGLIDDGHLFHDSAFRHPHLMPSLRTPFTIAPDGMSSFLARELVAAKLKSKALSEFYNIGRYRTSNPLLSAGLSMFSYQRPPLNLYTSGERIQTPGGEVRQTPESEEVKKKKIEQQALIFMGSTSRTEKNGMYFDASVLADPDPVYVSRRRTRGGVTEPFPEKLHRIISEAEENGNGDIISFCPHGRAFMIHDPERFVREILPKYSRQCHMSSFQRQLNLYGFALITSGPDEGGYYHELFLQGRPALCIHMRRVGVPGGHKCGVRGRRGPKGPRHEVPDFYSMATIKKNASHDTKKKET